MSDWAQVAIALITAIGTGYAAYLSAKHAVRAGVGAVSAKVTEVAQQQTTNAETLAVNTAKLDDVHGQLNSRLDQWKKETEARLRHAVEIASARAYQQGIESERNRSHNTESDLNTKIAAMEMARAPALILLVDDDDDCAEQFKRVTSKQKCELIWVKTRRQAMAMLASPDRQFDAVVADEKLQGGITGHEVILEISSLYPEIITVLSSGYEFTNVGLIKALGPTLMMPKPVQDRDIERLLRKIEQYRYWRSIAKRPPDAEPEAKT